MFSLCLSVCLALPPASLLHAMLSWAAHHLIIPLKYCLSSALISLSWNTRSDSWTQRRTRVSFVAQFFGLIISIPWSRDVHGQRDISVSGELHEPTALHNCCALVVQLMLTCCRRCHPQPASPADLQFPWCHAAQSARPQKAVKLNKRCQPC